VRPVVKAKREAEVGVTSLRTRGLLRVRVMRASYLGSKSIFRVLAEAEERNVPVVRYASVSVEADKVVVVEARLAVVRMSGMGYREYAAVLVSTIRKERRGLERER
jgi:hypothetical protein